MDMEDRIIGLRNGTAIGAGQRLESFGADATPMGRQVASDEATRRSREAQSKRPPVVRLERAPNRQPGPPAPAQSNPVNGTGGGK
jgi:hypothetical protein